jgi:riboflavin synthase alpha subunit
VQVEEEVTLGNSVTVEGAQLTVRPVTGDTVSDKVTLPTKLPRLVRDTVKLPGKPD